VGSQAAFWKSEERGKEEEELSTFKQGVRYAATPCERGLAALEGTV
jgi:hypothetical protein